MMELHFFSIRFLISSEEIKIEGIALSLIIGEEDRSYFN